jgi:predicted MFS family arabinose efflux permease
MLKQANRRGIIAFIVACFTSPCCTPLIVPLMLALIAGSPIALWISQNLGWVYGGLTLISIISLVLALRWLNKRNPSQPSSIPLSNIPVMTMPSLKGDKSHVQ